MPDAERRTRRLSLACAAALAITPGAGGADAPFLPIGNAGEKLPVTAEHGLAAGHWSCLHDASSGLTWEVKTQDGGPRDRRWTYTPYDDNPATNGGFSGYRDQTSGDCVRDAMPGLSCNTQAYIEMVNELSLCGHADWRLPTAMELTALAARTTTAPPADAAGLVPNIAEGWYWTGTLRTGTVAFARVVLLPPAARPNFYDGSYRVLLVRGEAAPTPVPRIAEMPDTTPHSVPTAVPRIDTLTAPPVAP